MAGTGMRMRLHRGILIYILSFALHATAGGAHSVTASFSLLSPPPPVCAMLLQADMSKRQLSFRNLPQGLGHYGDLSNIVRRGCGAAVIHLSDTHSSIVCRQQNRRLSYTYTRHTPICMKICVQRSVCIPTKTHDTYENPRKPYENRAKTVKALYRESYQESH